MRKTIKYLMGFLPDNLYLLISFCYLHFKGKGKLYYPNIKTPNTFNEKMLYSRRYVRKAPIQNFADKYIVREYVRKKTDEKYLVPLIGVYDKASDIIFETLPTKFVIKTNHGAGGIIVCQDKSELDITSTKQTLDFWLSKNYYDVGREWQYKNITPKIMIEEFLSNANGTPITDYKLFCFNGKPRYIQVDLDRFTCHKRQFYDLDWNLTEFTTLFEWEPNAIVKPKNLQEMIVMAEKLSLGFNFIRVDLYNDGDKIYFGELTLHHGGGCEPFIPSKYDKILGDLISI